MPFKKVLLSLAILMIFSCDGTDSLDKEKLIGNWVRPDGGYMLNIEKVTDNGRLYCGYYNPNPINVARSEWRNNGDELQIYVELQDVNYPGSIYTLSYIPEFDKLSGSYFQAATGQTYAVEFVRKKE